MRKSYKIIVRRNEEIKASYTRAVFTLNIIITSLGRHSGTSHQEKDVAANLATHFPYAPTNHRNARPITV